MDLDRRPKVVAVEGNFHYLSFVEILLWFLSNVEKGHPPPEGKQCERRLTARMALLHRQ